MEHKALVERIIRILEDHKASDIVEIDVSQKSSLADTFVIASASSRPQLRALADYVVYELEQEGIMAESVEGRDSLVWVLLDYASVMVHLFQEEARAYYSLDKLWKTRPAQVEQQVSEEFRDEILPEGAVERDFLVTDLSAKERALLEAEGIEETDEAEGIEEADEAL